MPRIPNDLLRQRKRLALSQDEVAFLMGTHGGAGISRYEQSAQMPSLETALALEIILQRPAKELFPGIHAKAQQRAAARARTLIYKTGQLGPSRRLLRKRRALANIISPEFSNDKQP